VSPTRRARKSPFVEVVVSTLRRICLVGAAIVAAGALVACSSAQQDWNKASGQNTLAAYQEFLNQHPNSDFAGQAQSRITALRDDQAWTQAQNTNTAEAFRQYLNSQPNGQHAAESRERITAFERADAWKAAEADGKAPALQAFLQKYPQGAEADQARARLEQLKTEAYRVQVAAFRAQKDADRAQARLQARYGKVLHEVVVVPPAAPEKLTTIRSTPMTLKEAQSACGTLKKEHQHCEVVKG
jgi:SPOR domain